MRVVEFLAKAEARLDDVAGELGIHKSNALRLLSTLRSSGWVTSDDARTTYRLSPRLVVIGQAAASAMHLQEALAVAEELRNLTGESTHVAVPHGTRMLTVGRVDSVHALRVSCQIGSEDHMHSSALGKAYLASLPDDELDELLPQLALDALTPNTMTRQSDLRKDIRRSKERGYSIDTEEGRVGVACMGVALRFDGDPRTVAVSITGPSVRWGPEAIEKAAPRVLDIVASYRSVLAEPLPANMS